MRKLPVTQIICCAVASLAMSTAWAHDDQSSSQSSQSASWQKAQSQEFFRASKVIGKDVQTSDRQKAGEVKEVVFNQQGEIFALVNIGSGKWAVVPWQTINPSTLKGNDNAQINTTLQALKSGPMVTQDQWASLSNPTFAQGVYSYYHVQSPSAVGGAGSPGGASQGQGSSQDQQQQQQQQPDQSQSPK